MSVTYVRNTNGQFEQVGPGGATTDTTLSLAGRPADAAAVGSALTNYATQAYVSAQINNKTVTSDEIVSALGYTPQSNAAIIPKTRGGAGRDISDFPANAIIRNSGSGGGDLYYTATASGACYATEANGYPTFGTLPVAQGGTGQTKAWTNGTVSSVNNTTITSSQFAVFPYLNKAFIRLNILTTAAIAADGAAFVALPSTIPTAHTALSCYNEIGYDIHCGVSSVAGKGVYIMNCGTSSMPSGTRLYIAGWYSV